MLRSDLVSPVMLATLVLRWKLLPESSDSRPITSVYIQKSDLFVKFVIDVNIIDSSLNKMFYRNIYLYQDHLSSCDIGFISTFL